MHIGLLAAFCGCFCLFATAAISKDNTYSFTTVVDSSKVRPDRGDFSIWYFFPRSLEGKSVLIQDYNSNACAGVDSLWASPANGDKYSKLVGIGQSAPGGTGNFEDPASPYGATAVNGVAVFEAADDASEGGLYGPAYGRQTGPHDQLQT